MKNFFDIKALKSSDDCDKFSKSVSYETLVGGTATTGTGIKQTRQLFLSSAVKPLSAVGTLTSLLCNSAKVVEKLLQCHFQRRSEPKAKNPKKTGTVMPDLIGHLSRIKKEAAEVAFGAASQAPCLGSRLLSCPRMTMLWILRLRLRMTFPVLTLLFTIATTAESWADDENRCINVHGTYSTCIDKLSDENGNNSCGTNCTFRVIEENGKQVLHVYKEDISKPATIREGAFSPNYYKGGKVLDANGNPLSLNNIMLDNDFEYSPRDAFAGSGAQISSASGKFVFNNGQRYFATSHRTALNKATLNGNIVFINSVKETVGNTRINGDVIISDNVKSINEWSFESTEINGNLIIPDTIKSVGQLAFRNLSISGQIYCASGIENCYNMIKKGCNSDSSCLTSLENLLNSKKFSAYPDGCEKLEANLKCTKCKSASFKLEDDGWCLRKIYTPAEATEVLRDDNTNEVTITFKK